MDFNENDRVKAHLAKNSNFYVSITGLRLKGPWKLLQFFWHAARSKMQAERAEGNLLTAVNRINGIDHTLTVWESQAAMKRYVHSGAHKQAIKVFRKLATGKIFGFESRRIPDWEEVHRLWKVHPKEY